MHMGEEKKKSRGFFTFIKAKGRLWLLMGGGLLGICLLLFGGFGGEEKVTAEIDEISARVAELDAYEARLEKELEALCESVAGVSDAEIMVSFSGGYAVRYTEDGDKNPVSVGSGSSEEALFDSLRPPAVAGVGIVCRGGSRAQVQSELTELVSTALGIPANRVYVTGK